METWHDADDLLLSFVSALNSFDWAEVSSLTSTMVKRLDAADSPFPGPIAKCLLSALRRKRQFRAMEQLADALIRSGLRTPEVLRHYAQSMIDQGSLTGAMFVLKSLLTEPNASPDEQAEANGLLGRISKQLYVNASNPSSPRQQGNLIQAIRQYYDVYRTNPAKFYWHGINTVALLRRASRDGVQVPLDASAVEIADELAPTLSKEKLDRWERATAVEHAIATGNTGAAFEHAALFVSDKEVDAFEVSSLQRQLIEVWQLDANTEPGNMVLPVLQAGLLRRAGSAIKMPARESPAAAEQAGKARDAFERVFGQDRYQPLDWLKTALTRCSAVGRVESLTGQKIGTGFLVKARDFFPDRPASEILLLTNSHVISPSTDLFAGSISPDAARVLFEQSGTKLKVEKLVWTSPPGLLDASFVTLKEVEEHPEICPLEPAPTPFEKGKNQRLYVIGHPLGGGLSISLQDSCWLDRDDRVLHYRTPTEPGSSGSPVFDQDYWTLIGLHHRGKPDMPKLNGETGTYAANEAISISALQEATKGSGTSS